MTETTIEIDKNIKLVINLPDKLNALEAQGIFRSISQVNRIFGVENSTQIGLESNPNSIQPTQIRRLIRNRWTEEDDKKLIKMRKDGFKFNQIGFALNRTTGACSVRYYVLVEKGLVK